jgi:hypothetical protein
MRSLYQPAWQVSLTSLLAALLLATWAVAGESVDIDVTAPAAGSSAESGGSAPAGGPSLAADESATAGDPAEGEEAAPEPPPPPGPTIMFRGDVADGVMTPTFNLMSKEVILWALYPNTQFSDYEIGKTLWEKQKKDDYYALVGYAAVWPHQHQYFVLPWFYSRIQDGKNVYTINLAEYVPLNDGPWTFVADGNSVMRNITKQVSVGVDSLYFDRDGLPLTAQWGPAINLASQKDRVSVYARAMVFGKGEDTYRVDFYFH